MVFAYQIIPKWREHGHKIIGNLVKISLTTGQKAAFSPRRSPLYLSVAPAGRIGSQYAQADRRPGMSYRMPSGQVPPMIYIYIYLDIRVVIKYFVKAKRKKDTTVTT